MSGRSHARTERTALRAPPPIQLLGRGLCQLVLVKPDQRPVQRPRPVRPGTAPRPGCAGSRPALRGPVSSLAGPNTRIDLRFTTQNGYYAPHLILEGPLASGSVPLLLGALEELPAGPDGRPRFGLDPRPLGFRSPAFPPSVEVGRDGPLFEVVGVSATTLPPTLVVNQRTARHGLPDRRLRARLSRAGRGRSCPSPDQGLVRLVPIRGFPARSGHRACAVDSLAGFRGYMERNKNILRPSCRFTRSKIL